MKHNNCICVDCEYSRVIIDAAIEWVKLHSLEGGSSNHKVKMASGWLYDQTKKLMKERGITND